MTETVELAKKTLIQKNESKSTIVEKKKEKVE